MVVKRSRGWTWTLNNYTEEEINAILDLLEQDDVTGYVTSSQYLISFAN